MEGNCFSSSSCKFILTKKHIEESAQSSCPCSSFKPFTPLWTMYACLSSSLFTILSHPLIFFTGKAIWTKQELVFIVWITMNVSETDLKLVCQGIISERSRGIFYGDNPLDHSTPTVLAQLSLSSLLSALTQYILTPLGESAFISMLLVKSLFFFLQKRV